MLNLRRSGGREERWATLVEGHGGVAVGGEILLNLSGRRQACLGQCLEIFFIVGEHCGLEERQD